MMLSRLGPIGLVVLLLLGATTASSAPPDSPEEETKENSALDEPRELIKKGDYAGAEAKAREALTICRNRHDRRDTLVSALRFLQHFLNEQGKHAEAERVAREALSATRSNQLSYTPVPSELTILGML